MELDNRDIVYRDNRNRHIQLGKTHLFLNYEFDAGNADGWKTDIKSDHTVHVYVSTVLSCTYNRAFANSLYYLWSHCRGPVHIHIPKHNRPVQNRVVSCIAQASGIVNRTRENWDGQQEYSNQGYFNIIRENLGNVTTYRADTHTMINSWDPFILTRTAHQHCEKSVKHPEWLVTDCKLRVSWFEGMIALGADGSLYMIDPEGGNVRPIAGSHAEPLIL